MAAEPVQVMVEVTDVFGNVESEPLYVVLQGPMVHLECDGVRMRGYVDELRAALEPRREIREQAA